MWYVFTAKCKLVTFFLVEKEALTAAKSLPGGYYCDESSLTTREAKQVTAMKRKYKKFLASC